MIRGFTLIETMVVVVIFFVMVGALVTFERDTLQQNSFYQNRLLADQDARQGLRRMVAELRTAVASDGGAYPIAAAARDSLTFFSDVDKNGTHDQVRYFLDGATLRRGVIKPAGTPAVYDPTTESVDILASGFADANQIIFSYFDQNYAGTSTPLSFPVDLSAIRLIKIAFKLDADTARPPGPATYSTQVVIRSLKTNQ